MQNNDERKRKNRERSKKWRLNNPEKVQLIAKNSYNKNYHDQWRLNNPEKVKEYRERRKIKENSDNTRCNYEKQYYIDNKDKIREQHRLWRVNNKDKIRKREKERLLTDPNFKLRRLLKDRTRAAIIKQYGKKSIKTIECLGSSIEVARNHIESKFVDGMSWQNHGKWEIDHIIPCASFDLINIDHQRICFHYTNLQPLWKEENKKKNDKLDYYDTKEKL